MSIRLRHWSQRQVLHVLGHLGRLIAVLGSWQMCIVSWSRTSRHKLTKRVWSLCLGSPRYICLEFLEKIGFAFFGRLGIVYRS